MTIKEDYKTKLNDNNLFINNFIKNNDKEELIKLFVKASKDKILISNAFDTFYKNCKIYCINS